ncbi:hypothetical protein [Rhodohalobacter barkolensis]|uniref:Uncharacterized protein n=1 Tax=Rhodohalobacter barkolensis TaxID=2053187 RepID=A0A2N0VIY1_9BACT|nr:hypothetical protein [Rhodohalobacter barkolensis]PKD44147.1 hypothetical protein CWD77_01375 [Rhodohalobacter barkolensis]
MKYLYNLLFYSAFLLILILTASCEEISTDNFEELTIEEIATLIDMEVGDAQAENLSSCQVIPIGAKPCGGPWGYLVYSEEVSDAQNLKQLVDRYNELDEIRMKEEGYGSTCDYATEPTLSLESGSCHGNGYAWNPGDILERNNINN